MSPESAELSGLEINARSDIDRLGVGLYELLAGSTPFDARVKGAGTRVEHQYLFDDSSQIADAVGPRTEVRGRWTLVARNSNSPIGLSFRSPHGCLEWSVDVAQLQAELTALGVDSSAYSLAGGKPHGRLVLDHEARGPWAVYYCEHGQKVGYHPFDAESAACHFFLGAMKQVVANARPVVR